MSIEQFLQEAEGNHATLSAGQVVELLSRISANKADWSRLRSATSNAIHANKRDAAVWCLFAQLVLDGPRAIKQWRRDGLLRPSKNNLDSSIVRDVLDKLLSHAAAHAPLSPHTEYLTSLQNLNALGPAVHNLQESLRALVLRRGNPLLKRMLAQIDLFFLIDTQHECSRGDKAQDHDSIEAWSKEELGEAFSYIVHLFTSSSQSIDLDCPVATYSDAEREVEQALVMACHIRAFFDWEALVDIFGYRVTRHPAGTFLLESADVEIERATRVGFIQSTMSMQAAFAEEEDKDRSIRMLAASLESRFSKQMWGRISGYVDRLTFTLPPFVFAKDTPLAHEAFFSEEIEIIRYMCDEWLLYPDQLLNFEIAAQIRVLDLLRAQRLFRFLAWCRAKELAKHFLAEDSTEASRDVALQSTVIVLSRPSLERLLTTLIPAERVASLIDYLSEPHEDRIDIQYRPLIKAARDRYFIPVNIFAFSNIVRNSVKTSPGHRRIDPTDERFLEQLKAALLNLTPYVFTEARYKFNKTEGETDVLAIVGDTLLVLEVKASLLPVDVHELRTSWDRVNEGAEQLDNFLQLFTLPAFRDYLQSKLGVTFPERVQLVSAVLMTNRMFTGFRTGAHCVRNFFEFCAFLNKGVICVGDERRRIWKGDRVSEEDVREYFGGDLTLRPFWDAMAPFRREFKLGDAVVQSSTFQLNFADLYANLGFKEISSKLLRLDQEVAAKALKKQRRQKQRQLDLAKLKPNQSRQEPPRLP